MKWSISLEPNDREPVPGEYWVNKMVDSPEAVGKPIHQRSPPEVGGDYCRLKVVLLSEKSYFQGQVAK